MPQVSIWPYGIEDWNGIALKIPEIPIIKVCIALQNGLFLLSIQIYFTENEVFWCWRIRSCISMEFMRFPFHFVFFLPFFAVHSCRLNIYTHTHAQTKCNEMLWYFNKRLPCSIVLSNKYEKNLLWAQLVANIAVGSTQKCIIRFVFVFLLLIASCTERNMTTKNNILRRLYTFDWSIFLTIDLNDL